MECRLVIKDYNSLYTIYLTKLCKVLIKVISGVIIVFNFYIYKELFSLINLAFKIFYTFILNQEALKIGYSNFLIPNILYTLVKFIIYIFFIYPKDAQLISNLASYRRSISFSNYFGINFYKSLHNCFIVNVDCTLYYIAYYSHYMFDWSSYDYISQLNHLG